MKASIIESPDQVRLAEMALPAPGPGEVLIRSRAVGICGSDVELYQGTRPEGFYRYPLVPGHEWSGEVAAIGEQVRWLSMGDRVVAESILSCGTCRNCRVGLTNLCEAGSHDERLAIGRRLGATHTINNKRDDVEQCVRDLTEGRGADLVFEVGSRAAGVELSMRLARRGGRLYSKASPGQALNTVIALREGALKVLLIHDENGR